MRHLHGAYKNSVLGPAKDANPGQLVAILLVAIGTLPLAIAIASSVRSLMQHFLGLRGLDTYRASSLAFMGQSKIGDVAFGMTASISVAVFVWALAFSREAHGKWHPVRVVLAVFGAPVIVSAAVNPVRPLLPIIDSPILIVAIQAAVILFYVIASRSLGTFDSQSKLDTYSFDQYAKLFLAGATPAAALGSLALLRNRNEFHGLLDNPATSLALAVAGTITIVVLQARFCVGPRRLALWTVGLAIGWAGILLPPRVRSAARTYALPDVNLERWRLLFIIIFALLIAELVARHMLILRGRLGNRLTFGNLVPSGAIAVYIASLRMVPQFPTISPDNYHFGEVSVPFYLFREYGQVPYRDFELARGLLPNMGSSFAAELLGTRSAGFIVAVNPIVALLVVWICHLLLRHVVGLVPSTAIVVTMGFANHYVEADLFSLTVAIFAISAVSNETLTVLKGCLVVILLWVGLLAYPLMGIVAIALTLAVASAEILVWRVSERRFRLVRPPFRAAGVLSGLAVAVWATRGLSWPALDYVVRNARSNSSANGISLDNFLYSVPTGIAFVAAISGFAAVVWSLISFSSVLAARETEPEIEGLQLAVLAVPIVFVFGLSGRYFGRIDAVAWSIRPTLGSAVTLGIILVGAASISRGGWRKQSTITAGIVSSAVIVFVINPAWHQGLIRGALGQLEEPLSWTTTNFLDELDFVGTALAQEEHLHSLSHLASVSTAAFGETQVINLSGLVAITLYLDWGVQPPTLAPYNLESASGEFRQIRFLMDERERPIFLSPHFRADGGGIILRTPVLGQHLISQYIPVLCSNWLFAVHREILSVYRENLSETGCELDPAESGTLWQYGIGAPAALEYLPVSFGRNPKMLSETAEIHSSLSNSPDLTRAWTILPNSRSPQPFLRLESSCAESAHAPRGASTPRPPTLGPTTAVLAWIDASGTTQSMNFEWGKGTFRLPLYAFPTMNHGDLRLEAPNIDCKSGWLVQAHWEDDPGDPVFALLRNELHSR